MTMLDEAKQGVKERRICGRRKNEHSASYGTNA
jgi:hypothetical protein